MAAVQQKGDQNLKRKQQKAEEKNKKVKLAKQDNKAASKNKNQLSDDDKKILERWENMRKKTKPFVHPIRRYMKELQDLKEEVLMNEENVATDEATKNLPPGVQQFHFTHFVPQDKNGNITGLKAMKVSMMSQVVTGTTQGQAAVATTIPGLWSHASSILLNRALAFHCKKKQKLLCLWCRPTVTLAF